MKLPVSVDQLQSSVVVTPTIQDESSWFCNLTLNVYEVSIDGPRRTFPPELGNVAEVSETVAS